MKPLPATNASDTVTDEQHAYLLDALQETRQSLRQTLADLSAEQLVYRPVGRWSVTDCVEHMALVEMGLLGALRKGMSYPANPDKRAELRLSDLDIVKATRSRTLTLASPEPFVPTGRFRDADAAFRAFDQARNESIAYVATLTDDLRTHYVRHPAFGWIDGYQAILVMAAHVERHRKQIDELRASPDFPAPSQA